MTAKKNINEGPIAILCHWHTGSTCLAKLLCNAGMIPGNKETGWVGVNEGQEHPRLSQIGNTITTVDNVSRSNLIKEMGVILKNFKEQADVNKWNHYGFKNNFFGQDACWDFVSDVLLKEWPDVRIVVSIRHPLDIFKSTQDPNWNLEKVVTSFIESVNTAKRLVVDYKAILIIFPSSYSKLISINRVVSNLGLKWSNEVRDTFKSEIVKNNSTRKEKMAFKKEFPEADKCFTELCKLSI